MGISPLARIEIFAPSAAARKDRELSLKVYLSSLSLMDLSSIYTDEFSNSLMEKRRPNFEVREDASLAISLLSVPEWSCHGSVSISPVRIGHPRASDWGDVSELCRDALDRGLCDGAILNRGCSKRFLFVTLYSRAVVATPDFSKLAVLSGLDLLREERLGALISTLDRSGASLVYCEKKWSDIVHECRKDPRFASVVKSPG